MRLQLFLSHSGACSRRRAMDLIKAGKLKVNGSVVKEPSFQVDSNKDCVSLNDKRLFLKENTYILLNKPSGVITTKKDRFAKRTVMDILPDKYRHLCPVGRLDKDTTGLLVLTNDGDLTFRLTHPSFYIDKVYIVTLDRPLEENHKRLSQAGVDLEDGRTSPCKITKIDSCKIKITIHEGRKRQIKRMFALFKYKVKDLKRIALGSLNLDNLSEGQWRKISDRELSELKKIVGHN